MTITATTHPNGVDVDVIQALTRTIRQPRGGDVQLAAEVTWQGAFRSIAPNPVEQLLAALGHCLAVGYAANAPVRVHGIELTDLRVLVSGQLDVLAFLGLRPGHAGFQSIQATIHAKSPHASNEQVRALHQTVVGSSPVGHTLTAPTPLEVTLA